MPCFDEDFEAETRYIREGPIKDSYRQYASWLHSLQKDRKSEESELRTQDIVHCHRLFPARSDTFPYSVMPMACAVNAAEAADQIAFGKILRLCHPLSS